MAGKRHSIRVKRLALMLMKEGMTLREVSEELDVPEGTLSNWRYGRRGKEKAGAEMQNTPKDSVHFAASGFAQRQEETVHLSTGDVSTSVSKAEQDKPEEGVKRMQQQILHIQATVLGKIEQALREPHPAVARLNALTALLEKITKLSSTLAEGDGQHDDKIEVEFIDDKGQISASPPWAVDDPDEPDEIPGGRLWTPLGKDGTG